MKKQVKKIARGFFWMTCFVAWFGTVGYLGYLDMPKAQASNGPKKVNRVHYVEKGESLWEIADHYVGTSADTRKVVAKIMRDNNLKDGKLQEGQHLFIFWNPNIE